MLPNNGKLVFSIFTSFPSFDMFIYYVFSVKLFQLPLPFHFLYLSNTNRNRTCVTFPPDTYRFVSLVPPVGGQLIYLPYFYTFISQPSFFICMTYVSMVILLQEPVPFHFLYLSNIKAIAEVITFRPCACPILVNTTGEPGGTVP